MSNADLKFIRICKEILNYGTSTRGMEVRPRWEDGTPAHTIKTFCAINRYDLSEEFPILTLRPINFKAAIDEILWIWQKKSNNVHDLNSHIWDNWSDETGSIGKAYGYQFSILHKYKEGWFDQVDRVLYDLKNNPMSRRILTNLYNHMDLHEMNLYPCVYGCTFNVDNGRLNVLVNQRSGDILVAAGPGGWNVVQYAILTHMLAQVSGLEPGTMVHVVADAHIYDRHVPIIRELIARKPSAAPKLIINKDIKDFYEFTVDDFTLVNYTYWPQIKNIPIAV